MTAFLEILPTELIQPILCQLRNKCDLTTAALVCRSFNYAATPLIYRKIDARIQDNRVISHPSATLLQRPELAQYVWHVTETGVALRSNPRMAQEITATLSLCTNLVSATWKDDDEAAEAVFMPFLEVLMTLPLKEFAICTKYDVGDRAWTLLNSMKGTRRLSVRSPEWDKPPRVLQGWAAQLGPTLRYLELGRCSGISPAILISVFSQFPLLQNLRILGVASTAIPSIITCLPNLIALDMDYQRHGNYPLPSMPLPHLQQLTIRANSVDASGLVELWNWTCSLIPHEGSLQSFSLVSFTIVIPLPFITRLICRHGRSLTQFCVGSAQVTPEVMTYLCRDCPALASLECSVVNLDMQTIAKAIEPAKNLHTLQFVLWIQACAADTGLRYYGFSRMMYEHYSRRNEAVPFSAEEVKTLMLRPGSELRTITFGGISYSGRWVRAMPKRDPVSQIEGGLTFEVVKDTYSYSRLA
ncbi:hypothetical protein SCLCIDRAFT_1211367 [Scleroderma citrinum Foug A]|uniref:F-box domain-containing protein n=1 Tax=Scleroderma citrinum Foug A TaxID=1036808 RepID=A0A0C3EE09_9AGAM|nr:hypothetical protein SCLCIDRAFT_1211367 [Scleroderma citrinum Foug A]